MPQPNVCDLLKGQRFEGFLLVRSSDQRTGGNGAKYLDLNLADRTGEVNAKVWDGNVPPPAPGSVVKVRGGTLEYNGRLQLRVERIRAMTPADEVDLNALTPCAPESPEAMLKELYDAVDAFQSQPLRDLTRELLRRFDEKLRYYPPPSAFIMPSAGAFCTIPRACCARRVRWWAYTPGSMLICSMQA